MQPDILFYVVGALAVFIVGLSKGGFAGAGVVSTPMLALVTGPVAAIGIMLPILIIQDTIAVAMYRRTFCRKILIAMIPGAAAGVCLAYLFAAHVPEWAVELALGLVSLVFSLNQLKGQLGAGAGPPPVKDHNIWFGFLSGLGSGVTSTIAHAGSPPFQIYVMPKRLDREMYVGTSVLFFAAMNWMKVPAYLALGQLSRSQLQVTLVFVPLAIFSSWLGVRLVRSIDVETFNTVISVILLGVSLVLIGQGVAGFKGL
jgi:uncharacterized membrane protein YfcA